jgi:hypothetical protein
MIIMEPDRRFQMLRPENIINIPDLAQLVAGNAFWKGSVVMVMRKELGLIFEDLEFASLQPNICQPVESPGRLKLVKRATLEPRPGVKMIVKRTTGKD